MRISNRAVYPDDDATETDAEGGLLEQFDSRVLKRVRGPVTIERSLGMCTIKDGDGNVLAEAQRPTGSRVPFAMALAQAIDHMREEAPCSSPKP